MAPHDMTGPVNVFACAHTDGPAASTVTVNAGRSGFESDRYVQFAPGSAFFAADCFFTGIAEADGATQLAAVNQRGAQKSRAARSRNQE